MLEVQFHFQMKNQSQREGCAMSSGGHTRKVIVMVEWGEGGGGQRVN